ncbi:MAG: DUF2505 domain-containing protein [Mycobacteriaceae bacterium]|nr:DUF2505 domain-containing protein [Mycobacteriaceae bacterium]
MGTRIDHTVHYPRPAAAVRGAFVSETYWTERLDEVGGPGARLVGISGTDPARVEMIQVIAEEDLPDAIRKIRKGDLIIHRTENWSATAGTYLAVVEGAPVKIHGTVRLTEEAGGCVSRMEGEVEVDVPLFGRKIEKGVAERLTELFQHEDEFTINWLTQH